MKRIDFKYIALFIWSAICTLVYIYYSARTSYVQSVNISTVYITTEKISSVISIEYITNLLFAFAGVGIFTFACTSLGAFLSRLTDLEKIIASQTSMLIYLATCFLLGNGIYSLVFLTVAGLYKINSTIVGLSLMIGILIGFRALKDKFHISKIKYHSTDMQEKTMFYLNVTIFMLALLLSSARISYDSSAIYFSNAKITSYSETIQYFTDDTFVASAFQNTIQFTALILLFGEQSARMFSWIAGFTIIIFTLALAEKLGVTQKARDILTTVLLTSTAFVDLLGDGKVDLLNSAVSMAAIYWLLKDESKKGFLLIGFLTGMSIIARPYNAFLFGVFIFLYYLQKTVLQTSLQQANLKKIVEPLFWIGLSAIPIGCFHLFANWMIQGNPLAFLGSLSNINPATGPWDNKPETMFALRILYPLVATFRNTPQSLGNISPLVIGFVPFILLSNIREKINSSDTIKILTAISIITLLLWVFLFFTVVEIRYVFFLWFILFIPSAQIVSAALESEDKVLNFINHILILVLAIFMILRIFAISITTYSPLDQNKNPQCKSHILCASLQTINKSALLNERVLSLSAYRYYLRNDLFFCSTKHDEYALLKESAQQNPNTFWEEVIRQGYTYIAYENDYTLRHLQLGFIPSNANTPSWIMLERIDEENSDLVAAYRIHLINPPIESLFTCTQNSKNILEVQFIP